jgi:hypothetical protein
MAAAKGSHNRANGKQIADAIRKAVFIGKRIDGLVKKLIDAAEGGDLTAMNMIFDRIDGKPIQHNKNEDEITVRHVVVSEEQLKAFDEQFNRDFPDERISH